MIEQREFLANAIEASVRIGLLLVLAAWCFDIVQPFVIPIAWGIIIAVAQYPGYRRLSGIIGLFVGAVVLTLGYKLLLAWVYERAEG